MHIAGVSPQSNQAGCPFSSPGRRRYPAESRVFHTVSSEARGALFEVPASYAGVEGRDSTEDLKV